MNNEIKEILDKLSNRKQETLIQGLRECQLKDIEHPFITKEEYIDKILDYITNLRTIEQQYSDLLSENAELQEELKGYKQERENLFKTTHDLQKEIKRLENKLSQSIKWSERRTMEWLDYKSRCEKLREYIDNLWSFPSGNFEVAINEEHSIDVDGNDYFDNLLNILNGGDKE